MKATNYIAKYLCDRNITHVFEVIGGMTTHLIDSISLIDEISIISMHHEQAAGFAAEGFARQRHTPGVALATSGPGATNLITAIGSCYYDSVPCIFITGQVNTYELKQDQDIRQLGFQETDIVAIVKPITKYAYQVKSVHELHNVLEDAFIKSMAGRKGPVLIDLPMDIQRADFELKTVKSKRKSPPVDYIDFPFRSLLENILSSRKPLILAGGGIAASNNIPLFRKFIMKYKIPVVHSLMGTDVLGCKNRCKVGLIGTYGNRWANIALDLADTLLVIGSRLDIRQTGANLPLFKKDKKIYQIDCESRVLDKNGIVDEYVCMDMGIFLENALRIHFNNRQKKEWLNEINDLMNNNSDLIENPSENGINPNLFFRHLSLKSSKASTFVADVGQNQMWAAQSLNLTSKQRFLTSGGMGAMGFSLPASIGAYYATKQPIVSISGDGGVQMNIQELETIAYRNLPIKIIIIDNQSLGMVRQFQESYFNRNYQSTQIGYSAPDFLKIAGSYGIMNSKISLDSEIVQAIEKIWTAPWKPYILVVKIDPNLNAYPKLAFNKSFSEMEPHVKPEKF